MGPGGNLSTDEGFCTYYLRIPRRIENNNGLSGAREQYFCLKRIDHIDYLSNESYEMQSLKICLFCHLYFAQSIDDTKRYNQQST